MKLARIVLGSAILPACITLLGCSSTPEDGEPQPLHGSSGAGGHVSTTNGGAAGAGNSSSIAGAGNSPSTGGYGNSSSTGGFGNGPAIGGSSGGPSTGGFGNGTSGGAGGRSGGGAGGRSGGAAGAGGRSGGAAGAGTAGAAGGSSTGSAGAGSSTLDCAATPAALTGGTKHASSNASGKAAGLDWTIWSNGSGGSITTYDVPAFSAAWSNSGDFLARIGAQWNDTKTYDQLGTVTAELDYTKTGTGGGYSYIGIYGWSVSPCVEWYIVDDSYNKMPVNPGSTTNKGTAMIDGGTYNLYSRQTTGTGGSKCGSTTSWVQFYSVRQTSRDCGQISISEHFKAWAAAGMTLGKMDQAQVLVEVGGGTGSVDFTTANVIVTPP